MPKIKEYEAPQGKIKPSFKGMEAAQQAGRYIYRIAREGNQDLTRGLTEIGSAIAEHEKRQDRKEAKAEREADRQGREEDRLEAKAERTQAKEERAQAKQDAEAKRQDKAKALEEVNQAKPEFAKLHQRFARELAYMEATTKPADLPAKIQEWREKTVRPAYEALSQQYFQSNAGQALGRKWVGTHEAAIYGQSGASADKAQGHAVMDQIHAEVNSHLETIMSNPEHTEDVVKQFRQTFNDTVSLTPPGSISTADTPQGKVAAVLKARGWSDAAITGALNNAEIESAHFRPDIVDGSGKGAGGAKGIFQLDPGIGDGKDHLTAYTNKYGNDWSIENQTNYMADWVEKNMKLYKNSDNPEIATRLFMTQFENPKDQSPAAQQLRIDQSKTSTTFATGAPMTPAMMNAAVKKTFDMGMHTYAVAQVHAVAAGHAPGTYGPNDPGRAPNPAAAKELMNNPNWWGKEVLTPQDRDPVSKTSIAKAIDVYTKNQDTQRVHSEQADMGARRDVSQSRAADYVNELYDQKGNLRFPKDWSQRVMADQQLRDEEKAQLVGGADGGVMGRLTKSYAKTEEISNKSLDPRTWLNPPTTVNATGPDDPSKKRDETQSTLISPPTFFDKAVAGLTKKPGEAGYVGPEDIINHIGTDLNGHDAAYLLKFTDPRNVYAGQELKALENAMTSAHDTLAPRNPDGSKNEAGEKAYRDYLDNYLIPQHRVAQKSGGGLSVLTPGNPDYLQKPEVLQRYAPGHQASQPASAEGAPSLNELFGDWTKDTAETQASNNAPDTTEADMEKDVENLGRTASNE